MSGEAWSASVERLEECSAARRAFVEYLRSQADEGADIDAAELIFSELLSNALRYGAVRLSIAWLPDGLSSAYGIGVSRSVYRSPRSGPCGAGWPRPVPRAASCKESQLRTGKRRQRCQGRAARAATASKPLGARAVFSTRASAVAKPASASN